jgi:SPP1 family predicted phage head-tail adaptor
MLTNSPGATRFQVDVYLPAAGLSKLGRRTGTPTLVLAAVPAAIEELTALELIRARKIFAEATHRVRITVWPGHGITSEHYLQFGARQLHIGAVVDAAQTGIELELLCREEV